MGLPSITWMAVPPLFPILVGSLSHCELLNIIWSYCHLNINIVLNYVFANQIKTTTTLSGRSRVLAAFYKVKASTFEILINLDKADLYTSSSTGHSDRADMNCSRKSTAHQTDGNQKALLGLLSVGILTEIWGKLSASDPLQGFLETTFLS